MLLKFEAFRDQTVHPAGATHHVKHRVTCHTLEVVVVWLISRLEALRPTRQFDADQVSVFQPFVQQAINGREADACVAKQRVHIRRR